VHAAIANHVAELCVLCRRFDVARLEVFGSAAGSGRFDPACSDVDFLVEFEANSTLAPLEQFFGLAQGLELVLGRRVDLVEPKAIRNPFVQAGIDRARELVYAA
jgi:uncharacterized protein